MCKANQNLRSTVTYKKRKNQAQIDTVPKETNKTVMRKINVVQVKINKITMIIMMLIIKKEDIKANLGIKIKKKFKFRKITPMLSPKSYPIVKSKMERNNLIIPMINLMINSTKQKLHLDLIVMREILLLRLRKRSVNKIPNPIN